MNCELNIQKLKSLFKNNGNILEYLKEIFAYPFYFKIMRKYGFSVILKTHNTLKISDCLSQENFLKNNFYT